jgi:hypothetical protein
MNWFLGILIAGLMVLTLVTLIRGIVAFMQSTREDLERAEGDGPTPMQLQQNKMMFRRIWFQAAAILVAGLLLYSNQS